MPTITKPTDAVRTAAADAEWSPWFDKLALLQDQPSDWTPACGPLPKKEVFRTAREFLECLRRGERKPSRLSRSVVGGIGITFKRADRKVYVELTNKGTVHALFSDGSADPKVEKVSPDEAGFARLVSRIRAYLDE
jgi:hypothetical protein